MVDQLDCVVIGAGVVGLAVGRSLALAGREVVVLEAESAIGMHTSSRNSEVIHAGLYYPDGSLKAQLCVRGREQLYEYCESHHVPVNRIGKLIVASRENEIDRLVEIRAQAERNGVSDLRMLDKSEANEMEPAVTSKTALYSPSTGVVDSHSLMLAIQGEIEEHDGFVLTHSRVKDIQPTDCGFDIGIEDSPDRFSCKTLINSAGLYAHDVANSITGLPTEAKYPITFAKGHYFAYQGRSPFNHLVYPIPIEGGLGVHATNDMGGAARFGPDVEWISDIEYAFDESRKATFADAIRSYFPDLDEARLAPAYTGIRPKLSGPGEPARDFLIQGVAEHGLQGLVNLFGIESPGLTAALAIGDYVAASLR